MSDSKISIEDAPEIGLTMRVAGELRRKHSSEFAKPGEMIELRSADGKHLSLAARRVFNMMIEVAAGNAWKEVEHAITKKALRQGHKSNERIGDILKELGSKPMIADHINEKGNPEKVLGVLIPLSREEKSNEDGALVRFRFNYEFIKLFKTSNSYGLLEAKAVLGIESKYTLALYEIGCQLYKRDYKFKIYSLDDLRDVLMVPKGKIERWQDFRRYVLELAQKELNHVAPFSVEFDEIREGRKISQIKVTFTPKSESKIREASVELNRHSVGRVARREGKVEKVAIAPALPPLRLTGIPGVPVEDIERLMKTVKRPQDVIARAFEAEKSTPGRGREIIQAALTD